ncbi:hypothetical protein WT27_06980 [Burkholderia territorii]|uniref:Uncharacterized protein n=1 Tax=Burkholderia territorii TaxID=1503055 RepID=A0A106E0H0_9BURK|nr:hypothetical protein [Burkholderia territorii]KVV45841.1 hypothetical protein WT27_06980 [Burkholderia territorii]KVX38732.1 hypothetical protein WT31_03215 [Burkholderia territorii]
MLKEVKVQAERNLDAMAAALPPPRIYRAEQNGGIGYNDVKRDPDSRVDVVIGPFLSGVEPGDGIVLFWNQDPDDGDPGEPVATGVVDDPGRTQVLWVDAQDIEQAGDGLIPVFYQILTQPGDDATASPVLMVRVKLATPGEAHLDPEPGTPYINDRLRPPTIEPSLIGEDEADNVVVTIEAWDNKEDGDQLTLRWNGQPIVRTIDDGDPSAPVVIEMARADLEAGGDGDALPVNYSIRDVVNNWSLNSPSAQVEVELDPSLLSAPDIRDALDGEIDLDDLGRGDVAVWVQDRAIGESDAITLTWAGYTPEGNLVPYSDSKLSAGVGKTTRFSVPYAAVEAIAMGYAVVSYTVGEDARRSRRATVRVVGEVKALDAPVVVEANGGGTLDPVQTATVRIEPYTPMNAGDMVELRWLGTKANGDPTLYPRTIPITGPAVGNPVLIPIPEAEVEVLDGGRVEVSYQVYPIEGGPLQSPAMTYRVEGASGLLPVPEVLHEDSGVLLRFKESSQHPSLCCG